MNKEFEELKKDWFEFLDNKGFTHERGIPCIYCDGWDFFLPHLISSDEVKREAYNEGLGNGWELANNNIKDVLKPWFKGGA